MTLAERAKGKMGAVTAARLSEDWMRELEGDSNLSLERRGELEGGLDALGDRFPEVARFGGSSEEFARSRGHGSFTNDKPRHGGRRRPRPPRENESQPSRPKPAPARPRAQGSRSRSSRGRATLPSLSLPRGGGLFWYGALGFAGLAMLYVILRSTETPGTPAKALPTVINGTVGALNRFLSLSDVFPATGTQATYNEGPGSDVAKAAARLHAAEIAHPIKGKPRRTHNNPHQEAINNVTGR